MSYYKIEYLKHKLVTYVDKDTNNIVKQDNYIEKKIKRKLSDTKGTQMFKKNDYLDIQEEIINSKLDLKIFNFLVRHYTKIGFVNIKGTPVKINYIAKKFNVSRQKVSSFIKKAMDAGFIKKDKGLIVLNPFILIPYNISDKDLYHLQEHWKELNK